jgi:hypothetical protein
MPNILLTSECNRRCSFCFAKDKLGNCEDMMSLSNAIVVMDFLKQSKYPFFRVMGGEPTLHPQFIEIITLALEKGFYIDVLSNATWGEMLNTFFMNISPLRLRFLLNIGPEGEYTSTQYKTILENLAQVSRRFDITLSFTIAEKNPSYFFLLELVKKYSIHSVRVSHALPIDSLSNAYLPIEDYRPVASTIMSIASELSAIGAHMILDNAILPCMFSLENIGSLIVSGSLDLTHNLVCKPIIDIGPDLRTWSCFCLSQHRNRSLGDFCSLEDAYSYYREELEKYRNESYTFDACAECIFRKNWGCQGGCIVFHMQTALKRAQKGPDVAPLCGSTKPHTYNLAEGVDCYEYNIPEKGYALINSRIKQKRDIPIEIADLFSFDSCGHIDSSLLDTQADPFDLGVSDVVDTIILNEKKKLARELLQSLAREKYIR